MSKKFDEFFWHDGNLVDITFAINEKGKSSVQINALFYKDEHDPERAMYLIKCESVARFNSTLDTVELQKNMFAGNIMNAYLKENTLWLYFTDGILEISAKKFSISKC